MGSAASAKEQETKFYLGYEHLSLDSYNGNGGVFGFNYVVPLKVLGDGVNNGVEVGASVEVGAGSNTLYGPLYGGSIGWDITKNFGIQAVYKDGSVKHSSGGPDVDISYTGFNIVWKK